MIQTKITIINKYGLHARAAAKFVTTASAFSSSINTGAITSADEMVPTICITCCFQGVAPTI